MQLKAGDSVQAQLDRMTFHCDAARREARRCQILLQQSIADRDVLRKQLEDTRGERDALHSRIHDLLDQLTRAKQSIQTSRPPCNMVLLDGSEHLSELAVHKGLAVMNARLRGEAGSGFIAACDVSDAWSELGTAQRYPDTRKTFVCADILAGMSVCVAGANLCVGGLGSVYHSGGGIFLVSALKRFAWERSSERNFLMPKDLAAERFWVSQGFQRCNPRNLGMSTEDLEALQDVVYISDPEDTDLLTLALADNFSRRYMGLLKWQLFVHVARVRRLTRNQDSSGPSFGSCMLSAPTS